MPEMPEGQSFDATALTNEDLATEAARIAQRGNELASRTDALTADEGAELIGLAERAEAVSAEQATRAAYATALDNARSGFSTEPTAVVVPGEETAPAGELAPVVAAAAAVEVPSVATLHNPPPLIPAQRGGIPAGNITAYVSSGAAGLTGKDVGAQFDGLAEIALAMIKGREHYGTSGNGPSARTAIAQFHRDRGEEFTVTDPRNGDFTAKLNAARNERNLHGGSLAAAWQHNVDQGMPLTAAAGWCAPSENLYDICRLWGAGVGILDLPTITVRRGGINYTSEPTFAEIYANAVAAGGGSNFLTEAQVIADTVKTCSELPCPDFVDRRLDVLALCIRVGLLQAAGYPELVSAWMDGLMAANEQEMNRIIVAAMVAQAGATTAFANPAGGDDSFTSALLAAVELAAEDIRYREGMPWNATVEIVLPHWVLAQIRADLSRRGGVNLLEVSDAQIANLFSVRRVRVQFIRGYQDGLITGGAPVPTFPGGIGTPPYLTSLPSTVGFLAYPAGSVAVARQDVITLTNVYDAASLGTNEFTALFTEEGFAPVFPCPGLRQYTVAGCVGGTVGSAEINCTAAA